MSFTTSPRLLLLAGAFGLAGLACDLPQKNIGVEDDDGAGDGDDDGGGSDAGGECTPGDTMPSPDGCNQCGCTEDGLWACTAIGCGDDPPTECTPGDTMPAPDGCNQCACTEDGWWACTEEGCPPADCADGDTMDLDCNTCTCEDGLWACTDIACGDEPDPGALSICEGPQPMDPFTIVDVAIAGDSLDVTVEYGGGCEEHVFGYCWDGSIAESDPPQVWTTVTHDGNGDACEALITDTVSFDLSALHDAATGGGVVIHLDGWSESLLYAP